MTIETIGNEMGDEKNHYCVFVFKFTVCSMSVEYFCFLNLIRDKRRQSLAASVQLRIIGQ